MRCDRGSPLLLPESQQTQTCAFTEIYTCEYDGGARGGGRSTWSVGDTRGPTREFSRGTLYARRSLRHVVRTLLEASDLLDDVERVVHDDVLDNPLRVVREERARADAGGTVCGAIAGALGLGPPSQLVQGGEGLRCDAAEGIRVSVL